MQECLSKKQVRNKHTYCMYSFKLIVYTTNEREEQDYKSIINRFEKEEKLTEEIPGNLCRSRGFLRVICPLLS